MPNTIDTGNAITPGFLESKGFAHYLPDKENSFDGYVPEDFDVPFDLENDLCFLQKEHDRNQFCVVLSKSHNGDVDYYCNVWVQEDVGCGFVCIPNNFTIISEYHFCLLYEAIRREEL